MAAKIVRKPWGREEWLEQNDRYCYKRLYIDKGERTSFQYHNKKLETNYVIEGKAEVWLEDDNGKIVKTVMGPGDFFTVVPPRKHRIVALTDIVLQECSTPEVDDVVRIEDDFHRPNGRIETEHMVPALCILAAGKGERLEHLGKMINKGLLPVQDKAVISHIIDLTPPYMDIVIAIGYCGDLIKEYCKVCHPDRNFIFVDVDKIEGEGTGPGYSLSCCKEYLQRPFYFVTADCIVDDLPQLGTNWLGVYPTGIPELYSTVKFDQNLNITAFSNKSKGGYDYAFIGLAGIVDFDIFWSELENNQEGGEVVCAFYNPAAYNGFEAKNLEWTDTGTIDGYLKARNNEHSLPKLTGQCLYRVNNKCVKLFPDGVQGRAKRAKILKNVVPHVTHAEGHILAYDWVPGPTLYELDEYELYVSFLKWCSDTLWQPTLDSVDLTEFCERFYRDKTYERYQKFIGGHQEFSYVNGKLYEPMEQYLERVPWDILAGVATNLWHGDLQFDNIIVEDNTGKFKMIDWRESFGGSEDIGDVHYDLAKLYGGVMMNYRLMRDPQNMSVVYDGDNVTLLHRNTDTLARLLPFFEGWVIDCGYDIDKIRIMTGMIYLNMAPLHEKPFADLLFYRAKEVLGDILNR